jgi:hypothetical protein
MSGFSDYIDSLEGKEDLDPLKIAHDLHTLYTDDVTTRDAKIEELNGTIAERDSAIVAANADVTAQKAKNFDLAMQIPGTTVNTGSVLDPETDPEIDPATISIDDLFVKSGN